MTIRSEIVDTIIIELEQKLIETGKHLIKTSTILMMCKNRIDLEDGDETREDLLEIGVKQVIQSRLYAHNYFSVQTGYFANLDRCDNIGYLNMMLKSKDNIIEDKIDARNVVRKKLNEVAALNGQMVFVSDESGVLTPIETKTKEEILADLEADAV